MVWRNNFKLFRWYPDGIAYYYRLLDIYYNVHSMYLHTDHIDIYHPIWPCPIVQKAKTGARIGRQNFRLLVALDVLGVILQLPAMHALRNLPGWTALAALKLGWGFFTAWDGLRGITWEHVFIFLCPTPGFASAYFICIDPIRMLTMCARVLLRWTTRHPRSVMELPAPFRIVGCR